MPGLALTTVWVPETTPQLLYCSAGSRSLDSPTAAVETTSAGCDAAMCYAARRETGGPSTRRWTFGPPQKNVTSDRGPRWRVCCYRDARVAIGMVAQDRFGQAQLRSFAERIAEIVAPVVDECAASAAHANAALAILAREVERCNDRGLGHLVPLEAASACVACGGALGKRGGGRDAMAVNCHDCGDVLCALCAPQLPGSGDGDEASGPRRSCGDCAHARQTGRRVLRMQPPTGGDEVKAFALRALFDERASDEGLLDEAGFVELCKAACRHPLVVEPRSLERELRHGANVLRLDVTELERRFRSAPQAALDFEAARNCLVESCRPAWPERALAGPPPDDDEETPNSEETKEERVVEDPAARAAAWGSASWWKPDKKPALRHASRTGWGSLVSRDGLVKKRVWLELRDAPPRTLRYAPDTASPRRALVYLNRVRVIRCDAPCTLQLRLNLPNDDVGDPDLVDAVVLRFETPSATCSWWSALSASRREAKTESRGALAKLSELSTLKTDDAMSYIVGGAWYNKMANFLVCAVDCTGGQPFEGPERPFMQLNRPPGPAPARVPGKPLGGAGNARKSSIIRARDVDRRGGDDFDADPVPELGDSLPERAFSVAGPEVKAAYQSLLKVIIRPPRATYDERRLGVADFAIKTEATTHRTFGALKSSVTVVHREDLSVPNERGLEVRASLWTPRTVGVDYDRLGPGGHRPPCVVYVHGNACNRLGALSLLRPLCLGGIALCAVDCAGSGNSGGEFVSLGHFERDDVAAVVDELKRKKLVGRVALWGRSMGAATALLYASTRDPDVAAVVADSPYSGLVRLCRELVGKVRRRAEGDGDSSAPRNFVAGAVTEAALALVRSSVKHRAGFDVYDVAPIEHVANMRHSATPALFVHGKLDDFINCQHSVDLHESHGGDASLLLLDVDHQANRPASALIQSCLFLYDRLLPTDDAAEARAKYVAHLDKLADQGHLGATEASAAEASGLSRDRQRAVEDAVAARVAGRFNGKGGMFG